MTQDEGRTLQLDALFAAEIDRRRTFEPNWTENDRESFLALCRRLVEVLEAGGCVFVCGNGGSAAQAQHFAAELVGRFKAERKALPALALTTDTSALTALGNDYGFEHVFTRQAEALMSPVDLLLGLSTSGNSPNVVEALKWAREAGCGTAALTGAGGGLMAGYADICVEVPSTETDLIQERHLIMLHILAAVAEQHLARP